MAVKVYDAVVIGAGPAGASAARTLTSGGMGTLLLEKKKLPRHKMCSGILSHWAVDFIHRNFGVIPESAYSSEVPFLTGFAAHLPSLPEAIFMKAGNPVPNIWRRDFDFFLAEKSKTPIRDGIKVESVEPEGNLYRVNCRRLRKDGRPGKSTFRARHVVAADGTNSRAVWTMLPGAYDRVPRVSGIQVHYHGKIDISPRHYHIFFYPGMGWYSWASIKDGQIRVGAAATGGQKANRNHEMFLDLLKKRYGLKIKSTIRREGTSGPILTPFNTFILGKDNFLVVGDAAGFMHQGGEGISCALTSGHLAGQAIIESEAEGQKALDRYRVVVRDEVELCLDQLNPFRLLMKMPMRIDYLSLLKEYRPRELYLMLRDFRAFMAQDTGIDTKMTGRILRNNIFHHLVYGRYPVNL